jgi:hypothetical protein
MQSANKRTGNVLKKPKLNADESATGEPALDKTSTDEPATDEPATDEPASEPAVLESINDSAIIEHSIMEPLESSRDVPHREDTDGVMARPVLVSPIDETTVGGTVDSDLPTITHADGMAILDEYFPKSAIDSRLLNSAVAPDELPTLVAILLVDLLLFLQFHSLLLRP